MCQHFHSQRKLLQIPACLAHALKFVNKSPFIYNPGAFQSAIFVLGLGPSDMACWLFKSGVSVFYSPLALLELSPTDFEILTL